MISYRVTWPGCGYEAMTRRGDALPRVGDKIDHPRLVLTAVEIRHHEGRPIEVWCEGASDDTDVSSTLVECRFTDAVTGKVFRRAWLPSPPPAGTFIEVSGTLPEGDAPWMYRARFALLDGGEAGVTSYSIACDPISKDERASVLDAAWGRHA